jgi:hypothetical protein
MRRQVAALLRRTLALRSGGGLNAVQAGEIVSEAKTDADGRRRKKFPPCRVTDAAFDPSSLM